MPDPTDEQIRARANRFWEEAGWPQGRAGEFSHRAERVLTEADVTTLLRQGGDLAEWRRPRISTRDAGGYRHQRDTACPSGRWRPCCAIVRVADDSD